jgi:hypothetical protein
MIRTPRVLTAVALVVAVAAAIGSLVSVPGQANRFSIRASELYLEAPLPYVALVILALVFRTTLPGAMISLIGALVLGAWGVYWSYGARDGIEAAMLPFVLLAGCGIVLLAQMIRWAMMRRARQQA